jgi:hypothetical protein
MLEDAFAWTVTVVTPSDVAEVTVSHEVSALILLVTALPVVKLLDVDPPGAR